MRPGDRDVSRRDVLAGAGLLGYGVLARHVQMPLHSRQQFLAEIDPAARMVGAYTAYALEWEEYVGTVARADPVPRLEDQGYQVNPLSAAKYHPETGELDDRSLRRVDPDAPRWQWHIHLWEREARTQLFSHYEYRPDPRRIGGESITDMNQRIWAHYDAKWDTRYPADEANYFLGATCERVRALLTGTT